MDSIEINGKKYEVLEYDNLVGRCFGFIYVTINEDTGKKYVGMHSSWKKSYLGSGNYLLSAIKKHGKDKFKRYIIDTADSYNELIHMEARYITKEFGEDITQSSEWYNITSGLQRGGNTWSGMTKQDRTRRAQRLSKSLKGIKRTEEQVARMSKITKEQMSDPKQREKISRTTKEAMKCPKLRAHLSNVKLGKKVELTEEGRKAQVRNGKENSIHITNQTSEERSNNTRHVYKVTHNKDVIIDRLDIAGGAKAQSIEVSKTIGAKVTTNLFLEIANTGKTHFDENRNIYGLEIERLKGSTPNVKTNKYKVAIGEWAVFDEIESRSVKQLSIAITNEIGTNISDKMIYTILKQNKPYTVGNRKDLFGLYVEKLEDGYNE